jgi:G6PDH family F420-dependent oxidoreductase
MLDEAIDVIRALLGGDYETYRGRHYTVEQLRLYDAPKDAPPIVVAAAAPEAAELAARKGDGYMNTSADAEIVKTYKDAGGKGPLYGKVTGCFAPDAATAKRVAQRRAPNTAMGGSLSQELALPRDFEAVAELVREEDVENAVVLGNDLTEWREKIDEFERAGFTHVCLHDVSTNQQEFIDFAKQLL